MFFEIPLIGSYKPKKENSRTGRITLPEGVLTPRQIMSQLHRLVHVHDYH
jgi:hypothetical protein